MSPLPQEKRYSYADLLSWNDSTRYELYDGQPVALASPSDVHQRILGEFYLQFGSYLKGKKCKAYLSPFDVRLFETQETGPENVDTVVQPDLMVICDQSKVDRRGIHGAPDLVIEILSPATAHYDKLVKFNLYQMAGVKEYWLADPVTRTVCVYTLEDGSYHAATVYSADLSVPVGILDDCRIELSEVFGES